MTHRTRAAGLGLAALILLGAAAQPAHAGGTTAPDTITFDNLPNEPGRAGVASFQNANGGNATFDGVTFSGNAFVLGDQFTGGGPSPLATPHSGNYAFAANNALVTTLGTTKTLYSLYLGKINTPGTADSVTINALGANNITLASLTDILTSTTPSLFDTSSFATYGSLITGYSLAGSNTANSSAHDFVGDDFSFSAPVAPPAPTVSGKFDFESNTNGQNTTFTDTSGGIAAKFSTPADTATTGGFQVFSPAAAGTPPPGFSGNLLRETQNAPHQTLSVGFDQTLLSGSVAFASDGGGAFTVQELLNGVAVGTATANGSNTIYGTTFGTLSFGGVAFNSLNLSDTAYNFEIDNLAVTNSPSAAPEPSQLAGLSFTALGLGALLLRARRRKAQPG